MESPKAPVETAPLFDPRITDESRRLNANPIRAAKARLVYVSVKAEARIVDCSRDRNVEAGL